MYLRNQIPDGHCEWRSDYLKEAFSIWWDNADAGVIYLIGA